MSRSATTSPNPLVPASTVGRAGQDDELDVVTLSEVEHFAYCERQWALISRDQTWAESASTVVGQQRHERVDTAEVRMERGVKVARSLRVWSDTYGLLGRCDLVELPDDGPPVPVEYKSGRRALRPAQLQLTAQATCLEEMLATHVPAGAVWLGQRRRRVDVPISPELRCELDRVLIAIRARRAEANLPSAVADARCPECSLHDLCLPELLVDRRRVAGLHAALFSGRPSSSDPHA